MSDNVETITTNGNIDHCSFVYGNPNNNGKHKEYAVTLDSLWEDELIKNIGMVHLDVEGMEYRVLKGGNKMINKYRPIITYEQHLNIDDTKIIKGFLQEKKYNIFMIDEILPGCRSDCRNFLALPFDTALNKKIVNDINKRKLLFKEKLKQYLPEYGKELLNDFFLYWSEHNENGKKMRWEKERTFGMKARLNTWSKRVPDRYKKDDGKFKAPWS